MIYLSTPTLTLSTTGPRCTASHGRTDWDRQMDRQQHDANSQSNCATVQSAKNRHFKKRRNASLVSFSSSSYQAVIIESSVNSVYRHFLHSLHLHSEKTIDTYSKCSMTRWICQKSIKMHSPSSDTADTHLITSNNCQLLTACRQLQVMSH